MGHVSGEGYVATSTIALLNLIDVFGRLCHCVPRPMILFRAISFANLAEL